MSLLPHARGNEPAALARAAGFALFLLLLGWYILTMSGHTYASDEETVLAAGESLLSTGSFAISPDEHFLMNTNQGVDGQLYSIYGPLQSALVVPFVAAGRGMSVLAPSYRPLVVRLAVLLLPGLATAATAALLVLWVVEVGFSRQIGLLVGLLFGLTSFAWPHSRTFFAESLATFFLTLCAYGLRRHQPLWWAIAGAAAAAALATKIQTGLALPALALYALASSVGDEAAPARALARRAAFGLLGLALPLALLLTYNTQIFGSPTNSGYGPVGAIALGQHENWRAGLYGLTFSTGKGLIFYAPSVLLGLAGLGFRLRQQWREALLSAVMLALHLGFYSKIGYWHGDGAWGPRYLVFVLPFIYLPAVGLLATALERPSRAVRAVLASLAALSFAVQLLPVLVNFNLYIHLSNARTRYFTPAASPLLAQPRIWLDRAQEWWWIFAFTIK
jgi:4-amino-4-deoxy-L-arabinose transferase-like glycosyltransferase